MKAISVSLLAVCGICLIAAGTLLAKEQPTTLDAGEAYVIAKSSGPIRGVWFRRVGGKESFVVRASAGPRLVRIKAGRYYMSRIESIYSNISLKPNPEPSPEQALEVREGAITYIGDWIVDDEFSGSNVEYQPVVKYEGSTVTFIAERYELSGLRLFMARVGYPLAKMQLGESN